MAGNIFISYRRTDAAAWAGRLHMALEQRFNRNQLFMDVDNIKPGSDFVQVLDAQFAKCDVMLPVIGNGWLEARNERGLRRIDDPEDFVRIEIESALKRDKKIVPVLVDGASMPRASDLPESLKPLARRQAFFLSHNKFGSDVGDLAKLLGEVFAEGGNWESRWGSSSPSRQGSPSLPGRGLEARLWLLAWSRDTGVWPLLAY